MRRSGSISLTSTSAWTPYTSHSHRTRLPASSRPLPLLNQKREVSAGSTIASKTSRTGLRIISCALATGARFVGAFVMATSVPSLSKSDAFSTR
jgi:hypothetical protein